MKLYSVVECVSSAGSSDLQKSLDNVSLWANLWLFSINTTKTTVLKLSNSTSSFDARSYSLNNAVLSHSSIVSDLGILTDSHLLFKDHINSIISKSYQRSGAIFRGFVSRNPTLMRKAFITYVRPILEYNSCIWNPLYKNLIDSIENVLRRFTRRIPYLSRLSYAERLAALNLDTLELRRLRIDLITYYKILNNLTPLTWEYYFNIYIPPCSSRTPLPILVKPTKGSAKFFSSFFNRSTDC